MTTSPTFPEPSTIDEHDVHFHTGDDGSVHAATITLGDNEQVILGIDDGSVRIAELPRERFCAREAIFIAWALSVLAANETVRW